MDKSLLAQAVFRACHLQGDFLLRSGLRSNEYFDKYRFEAQPEILKEIAKHLAPMVPPDTQALAGLEMGGIPIATALSLETGIPMAFIRKEAKKYGTCKFAEGLDLANKKTLVVEDIISTGGQVLESTRALRKEGALIETALCVIFRGEREMSSFEKEKIKLTHLFTKEELKQ